MRDGRSGSSRLSAFRWRAVARRGVGFPRTTASTAAHGYGATHEAERRRWQPLVEAGGVPYARSGLPIVPGTAWHQDHRDDGPAAWAWAMRCAT